MRVTLLPLLFQIVQTLVDFTFLELADDLHVLLGDGVVLEVVELGGVLREVQQVDASLMLNVELLDEVLHVEVAAA